jgi:hypothetical protein
MTFSQQYRGTEWGEPLEPGPPLAASGARRRSRILVVLGAAAIAAALAWTTLGGRLPFPGASPTPGPNGVFAQRFLKVVTKHGLAFRVSYRAVLEAPGLATTLSGRMDVSGDDFAGPVTVQRGTARLASDVVFKSGRAYARMPKIGWTVIPGEETGASPNLFENLSSRSRLVDLGQVKRSGRTLRHLRTTDWLGGEPNRLLAGHGAASKVETSMTDFFVTGAGLPVEAALKADMSAVVGGKRATVTVRATYRFTRLGSPVRITAPKLG